MIAKTSQTLLEYFEGHFVPDKLRHLAPSSLKTYRTWIWVMDAFLGRSALVADLTTATHREFVAWIERSPYSAPARLRAARVIRALWEHAHEQGMAQECPFGSPVPMMEGP